MRSCGLTKVRTSWLSFRVAPAANVAPNILMRAGSTEVGFPLPILVISTLLAVFLYSAVLTEALKS